MKSFVDTSVLVPVFFAGHVHHEASLAVFVGVDKQSGCCGAHSLAEVYSTLTRMPGRNRISGDQAMLFVDGICKRLSVVALTGVEYAEALRSFPAMGIVGAGIYDALPARCALKAKAEIIYSWNSRHYALCGAAVLRRLRTPSIV